MVATIMHVVELEDSNPWLNGIAKHYDRSRFRHLFVSVGDRSDFHVEIEKCGVATYALGATRRAGYPAAVARLARLLRREHVDIVQTHLFEPSVVGLAGAVLARTPVRVVTRHYSDLTTLSGHPAHRWLDGRQARVAHRVIAASGAVRDAMVDLEGVPRERITVANYAYEFDVLKPVLSPEKRKALREEMGGDDRKLLVMVARLADLKGHTHLLQAIPGIVAAHPTARVVFVGEGPDEELIAGEARERGVADRVTFLGWRDDAWQLMEAADLVVHPSLTEAFCSVIIEAMAVERPLVTTRVGGAPEQVDDGESGVLVPAEDPRALCEAVVDLLSNPEKGKALGQEARRRVVERFSFPVQMARYEAIYDELLRASPSRTPAEKWAPTAKR